MNNPQDPLQNRERYIGSSDSPIVMGVSKWRTRYQLWLDKLGLGTPQEDNWRMSEGRRREAEALEYYEDLTGHIMTPKVVYHPEHEFLRASFDGITLENDYAVEIKWPGKEDHECAMDGVVPTKYYPQVQHFMFCEKKLDYVDYLSCTDNSKKIIMVERDQKYIDLMFQEQCKFWDHVKTENPPELCERDYVTKTDEFFLEVEKRLVLTRTERLELSRRLKDIEKREKELLETLISMSGDRNCKGHLLQIQKVFRKGNIDYPSMPQIQNVDCELYRKPPTEYWKIGDVK